MKAIEVRHTELSLIRGLYLKTVKAAALPLAGLGMVLMAGMANSAATISLIPSEITVGVGDEFAVEILATGFDPKEIGFGQVSVEWTPGIVDMGNTTGTWVLGPGLELDTFAGTPPPSVDNSTGILQDLNFVAPLSGPVAMGPDWLVATLYFTAGFVVGDTNLILNSFTETWELWSYIDNTPVVFAGNSPVGAVVHVVPQEVPIPAAAWLFGSGLLGLAAVRRRKASA